MSDRFDQFTNVLGGKIVQSFVGEKKQFIGDPLLDGKPVKVNEDRSYMFSDLCTGKQSGCSILNAL